MEEALPADAIAAIVAQIENEMESSPPTIAVIGLSGVGKSSTINAMFGTGKRVSATTRGTARFSASSFDIVSTRLKDTKIKCQLKVYDAPGLGEDMDLDDNYLARYRRHLPKCDIALWILAARNRALALDQQYLEQLADLLPNLVIGLNQVDLVDPLDWNPRINMPSASQERAIEEIIADRQEKLGRFLRFPPPIVAYSATRFYNLQKLFLLCLQSAPARRRWMFELLKSFSTEHWLSKATGLTAEQKSALKTKYIKSDAVDLRAFAGLKGR